MSQEEFGLYGYLVAMVSYLALLMNGGFYLVQSKLYLQYPEDERGDVLYTLNVILGFILLIVLLSLALSNLDQSFFLLLFKHPFDYSLFRLPLLMGVFATAFQFMITYYFLASGSIKKLQLFNILRIVAVHSIVLGLLYTLATSHTAYIRVTGAYFVEFILVVIFMISMVQSMTKKWRWTIVRESLALAFPITVYIAFSLVIFMSDRFFIERLGSMKDLAIYNLAWVLAGAIPFISNSIHSIWLPELLKEKDHKLVGKKARAMGLNLIVGFAIVSIGIIILVKMLLQFSIIDEKYEEVIPVLPIVLIGSTLLSLFQIVFNYLLSISRIRVLVYISFIVAIGGVWITQLLVLKWGVYGAALSMVIMNLGLLIPSLMYSVYFYKKHTSLERSTA